MRNALLCLVSVVVLSSAGLMATTTQQPPSDKRAQAKKLLDENNFNGRLCSCIAGLALDTENTGKARARRSWLCDCLSQQSGVGP